jgi:excisionase family DNA binding protein
MVSPVLRDVMPLNEVAAELGVSRRRVQAMVEARTLVAEKIGSQWFVPIESVQQAKNTRREQGGRPLNASTAWKLIAEQPFHLEGLTSERLDSFRRKVRSRAKHSALYVHPSVVDALRRSHEGIVFGGRDAAVAIGTPVDLTILDIYVRPDLAVALVEKYRAMHDPARANLYLHTVADDAWPFESDQMIVDAWTAWLDLEDRQDRAAFTLLDRMLGGRILA